MSGTRLLSEMGQHFHHVLCRGCVLGFDEDNILSRWDVETHCLNTTRDFVLAFNGFEGGVIGEGVCGLPLVYDDYNPGEESDGAILGPFSWSDQNVIENLVVGLWTGW